MSRATRTPFGENGLVEYLDRAADGCRISLASSSSAMVPMLWIRLGDRSRNSSLLITADDAHEIIAALGMWLEDVGEEV